MVPAYTLGQTLLKIDEVSLAFGDVKKNPDGTIATAEKLCLYGVNAEVKDIIVPGQTTGQVIALLGPSGMGKTQLFRIIAGLNNPTTGSVLIGPEQVPVQKGMVGVVPQNYPLFEHRRVLGNLTRAGMQGGMKRAEAKAKAMQYLAKFQLTEQARHWPCQLSGGQRQRVAIIRQRMCSKHFLLMDEPFSGLDTLMLEEVIKMIREDASADELNTIIVITHDVTAAVSVADSLWVLGRDREKDGSIVPGAYIKYTYNLIDEDLAWQPDIMHTARFLKFVSDIKLLFHEL